MSTLEFNGRMNVFTTALQMSNSHLQVGQYAKVTDTGKEYQIVDSANVSQSMGILLASGNKAIPLSEVVREFSTMTEVKSCPNLHLGDKIRTWGSNTIGDSSGNDYVIIDTSDALSSPVDGDERISAQFTARVVNRRVGQTEKIVSLTVPEGTAVIETKMPNMSLSPKIFVDGMLLTAGEHYEILDHTKGTIKLLQTYLEPVNLIVIDSQLFSGSANGSYGGRYHSFIIPANTTEVNCGLARLSAHPLLVVNGLHLTLGTHWNIVDGSTGDISITEPYERDAEAIILDNYITGSIDANTLTGFKPEDFVKTEETDADVIENIKKSKYEIGDIILVTKPKAHYVIYEQNAGAGAIPINPPAPSPDGTIPEYNGSYLNYWYSDIPYRVNTLKELQDSTIYKIGDVVEVYGNTKGGDGYHHLRVKVADAGDDTVPSTDKSGYWKLVPNSMVSSKAESGGSTKTLKEVEDSLLFEIGQSKFNIIPGLGLEGGGNSGDINISLKINSPAFRLDESGLGLNLTNDLTTGGADNILSAEQGKVLKGEIDKTNKTIQNMENNKLAIHAGNGISGSGDSGTVTVSIKKQVGATGEALLLDGNGLGLKVRNDLSTGGANIPLAAEQGKVLYNKLLALKGVVKEKVVYQGVLPANGTTITAPAALQSPALYLDGVRIDPQSYDVSGTSLTLKYQYSPKYSSVWVIEDWVPTTVALNAMERAMRDVDIETERMRVMMDNLEIYALNTFGIDLTKQNESLDGTNGGGVQAPLIRYIQDEGLKVEGRYYIDRNTDEIYKCVKNTEIIENNPKFFVKK